MAPQEGPEGVPPEQLPPTCNVGDEIKADVFAAGDHVDVHRHQQGQGLRRRYQALRRPAHPNDPRRRPCSPSRRFHGLQLPTPSRIFKGKIGAGQMGGEQVTVENLDVVKVDAELNLIAVRGAIPGPKGGVVYPAQHRQDHCQEEGRRRRHQQQPAEGFRPRQSAEGFRQKQVRKGEYT